ncbi:winged helix-turn-helix transcriptional regulator [Pseudomonas sp. NA-150]|uniref:winged helix-turn-helix transcriptional regulator n=1 Tax=Pseudomonas sp. NA-150 TaxID=3367525 RepID=UPI0037C996C8
MVMGWDEVGSTVCPVARSLSIVGDRWTLLIMRELSMGVCRFDDIQAQTGASSYLLSTRLKRLEKDGVIERRRYNDKPPRFEYVATAKGRALDPILLLLRSWGMTYGGFEPGAAPAVKLVYKATGEEVGADWHIPGCEWPFSLDCLEGTIGAAFEAEREERKSSFRKGGKSDSE